MKLLVPLKLSTVFSDENDTTTLSHHPYILRHFAATYINMLCVFVSCVQRVAEGNVHVAVDACAWGVGYVVGGCSTIYLLY